MFSCAEKDKGCSYAEPGFGYKMGVLMELTGFGKKVLKELRNRDEMNKNRGTGVA